MLFPGLYLHMYLSKLPVWPFNSPICYVFVAKIVLLSDYLKSVIVFWIVYGDTCKVYIELMAASRAE